MRPKPIVFLLLSEDKADFATIRGEIPTDETCLVECVESFREVIERVLEGGIDGLVVNLGVFDLPALKVVSKLKAFSPTLSTIVTSATVLKDALQAAKKMKRIVVLEKPYGEKQLTQFCEKIKAGEEIYQRQHERFPTRQNAVMQRLPMKTEINAIVHNMSKGGAFFEYSSISAEMGDVFKISISLDRLGKLHIVYGEVVRLTGHIFGAGKLGLGIRFMDEQAAYAILAEKI